jgi:hypothetical protein
MTDAVREDLLHRANLLRGSVYSSDKGRTMISDDHWGQASMLTSPVDNLQGATGILRKEKNLSPQ